MKKGGFLIRWITAMALVLALVMPMSTSVPVQAAGKLELNKKKVSLYVGQRSKLVVKNAGKKKIVWSTSNKKIARVSQKGSILAVKAGTATVKATVKGTKKSVSCKIVVGKYATKLNLNSAENIILKEGETTIIDVSVSPAKVLKKTVTYKSSNPSIATVSDSGEVTVIKQGLTEITIQTSAKNKKGKKLTKTVMVYVQPADEVPEDTEKKEETGNTGGSTTGSGTSGGGSTGGSSGGGSTTGGNTNSGNTGNSGASSEDSPVTDTIISGNTQTYVLDKNYTDQMTATITVNGKTWNRAGTVEAVLDDLEHSLASKENSDKTLRVNRDTGDEWWTVTDMKTDKVLFRVKAESTYNGSSEYGQIVVEEVAGDVTVLVR